MNDITATDSTPRPGNDLFEPYDDPEKEGIPEGVIDDEVAAAEELAEDEVNAAAGIPPDTFADGEPPFDGPPSGDGLFDEDDPDEEPTGFRTGVVRPRDDRWVAGVASGLASATGIDVRWIRIGFAIATLFGGTGVVLYGAGWLIMPGEGERESIGMRLIGNSQVRPTWLGFLLLLAGGMILAGIVGIDAGPVLAIGLLVGGYALYRGDIFVAGDIAQPTDTADEHPSDAPPASYVWQVRESSPPRPPRPRSYLGRLTIGSLLVTLGVMGALDYTGVTTPTTRHYAGAMLLVIGAGLVVGTLRGRARSLIVLGALLVPPAAAMSVADFHLGTDVVDLEFRPTTVAEIRDRYANPAGRLLIDLTGVDFNGESVALDLDIGVGDLDVYVPENVRVETVARMDVGDVRVDGRSSSGPGAAITHTVDGPAGTVNIDARGRIGSIGVSRFSVSADAFSLPPIDPFVVDGESTFFQPTTPLEIPTAFVVNDGQLDLDLTAMDDIQIASTFTGNGIVRIHIPSASAFSISTSALIDGLDDALILSEGGIHIYERQGLGSIDLEAFGPTLIITEEN